MDQIINFLNQSKELIAVIVSLVLAVIAGYKAIINEIKANKAEAKLEAIPLAFQESLKAELDPVSLLGSLSGIDTGIPLPIDSPVTSNDGKRSLVMQSIAEKKPELLKKMKFKDALEFGGFVSSAYQMIKPIIKAFKK